MLFLRLRLAIPTVFLDSSPLSRQPDIPTGPQPPQSDQPPGSSLYRLFREASTQEELDSASVTQLVAACSALNNVRAGPPSGPSLLSLPPLNIATLPSVAMQRFYSRNRKKSFNQVTGHKSEIPIYSVL